MSAEIVVIADCEDGRPAPIAQEMIAFALLLREDKTEPIRAIVPGTRIGAAAAALARTPGVSVTGIEGESLDSYSAEAWKGAIAPLLAELKPRFVCIPHTANGADFAPGLAVRLGAACITAVEAFRIEADGPVFRRSIYRGKLQMDIAPTVETTVLTLLPGAFRPDPALISSGDECRRNMQTEAQDTPAGGPAVEVVSLGEMALKTRSLGLIAAPPDLADLDLAAAEVVVAAGRGIGGEENLILLERLASLFSRAALGASRAVCDAGWLPYRRQIGQTGKTVSPRLYVACGISGAVQHLAGMRGSQYVVAINRDPQAAIFRVADVAVVEEIVSFLPLLIDACRERTGCEYEA
jgi:electron transfer flavoprotein alpha subunit